MDGSRFDRLARTFAATGSRRHVLAGMAAGAFSFLGLKPASAARCRTVGQSCRADADCCTDVCGEADSRGRRTCSCPPQQEYCDRECRAIQTDPNHCGGCDLVCTSRETCAGAQCLCLDGYVDCPDGCLTSTEMQTDPNNCGECGNICHGGRICAGGDCDCPDGAVICGDVCADLDFDDDHCGECDNACTAPQTCNDGECGCANGGEVCGDVCADLDWDNDHCGECGNACTAPETCDDGFCGCENGGYVCGDICAKTWNDENNCGECGNVCDEGVPCINGSCGCDEGETACFDSYCADLETDDDNCGECGTECGSNLHCEDSHCVCDDGLSNCSGQCLDLARDDTNCGSCGRQCTDGKTCGGGGVAGQCGSLPAFGCTGQDSCDGSAIYQCPDKEFGFICYVTSTGAPYCGGAGPYSLAHCVTNADCTPVHGPGSACVQAGSCSGNDFVCRPPGQAV